MWDRNVGQVALYITIDSESTLSESRPYLCRYSEQKTDGSQNLQKLNIQKFKIVEVNIFGIS